MNEQVAAAGAAVDGVDAPTDVVNAYFAAVNDRRWGDLGDLFAEDAELRPVGSRPRMGRADITAYYPPLMTGFSKSHDSPRALHVSGDVITVEIAFTGTTTSGREVAFDAVDLFRVRDGQIVSLRILYDVLDVIRQTRDEG